VRSTRLPRLLAATCALLLGSLLLGGPTAVAAESKPASASLAAQVAALNARIDQVSDELAADGAAYEAAEQELQRLTQSQFAAGADHDALQGQAAASRDRLAGLARAAYKGGMPPVVTALLSGDPRAVSDLAYVQKSVNRVGASRSEIARDLDAQNAEAVRALEQSGAMRAAALASRQALDAQVAGLAEKTDRLTAELTDAASRLEQARAAEQEQARLAELARMRAADQERVVGQVREIERQQAAAVAEQQRAAAALQQQSGGGFGGGAGGGGAGGGGAGAFIGAGAGAFAGAGCQPASPYGEANGFLSPAGLCPLTAGGGHRLRTDASRAFEALSRARQAATGAPLCVTDSYRSYPAQVDVFKSKPGLAATPGRSQHGWGLAVDLCGGVQTFGSEAHVWMQLNAPRYGWIHPGWARAGGSRPEAWHWEYVG
jgi:hypothetical protein